MVGQPVRNSLRELRVCACTFDPRRALEFDCVLVARDTLYFGVVVFVLDVDQPCVPV